MLTAFLLFNGTFSHAQSLLISVVPSLYGSKQGLKSSLVEIKTVDAEVLQNEDGKAKIGSVESRGQGIVIDPSGIIVTNTHIIAKAKAIHVHLADGQVFEGKLIFHADDADFSFIKIEAPHLLKAIAWGNSSEIQIGNPVIAFAHSNSNLQSPLGGQVTSLIKNISSGDIELLELKLNLKPGDSGGPILNEQGCLLGVIMGNRKSDNTFSYAIAVNKIQQEFLKYRGSVLVKNSG